MNTEHLAAVRAIEESEDEGASGSAADAATESPVPDTNGSLRSLRHAIPRMSLSFTSAAETSTTTTVVAETKEDGEELQ